MSIDIDPRDTLALQQLCFDYAAANDDRDVEAILACFTPDGTFGLQVAGQDPVGPFGPATTPDAATFFAETLGQQSDQRRHVVTNVRFVDVEPDRCTLLSYFTLCVTDAGTTQVLTTGVYRDEAVRLDGAWRFASKWLDLDGTP